MSEIKVNLENLKDNEREQLLALIEKANKKPKRFKPEKDGAYWFVNSCGDVKYRPYNGYMVLERYDLNNCFETKEEAEFEAEKREVIAELEIFAIENNDEVDWNDNHQYKHSIICNIVMNILEIDYCQYTRSQGTIYFSSEKLCEQAIEKVGADRIKKYLFGVEK